MAQSLEQLGIDRLNADERLELIGQIWDSLDETAGVMPEWHLRELELRIAEAEADPEGGIPLEVIKNRFADRKSCSP